MTVHDYNGSGYWSSEAIQTRYQQLAGRFRLSECSDLRPLEAVSPTCRWIYPVMFRVIEGIERGDPACVEIGVEFIEQDQSFAFGRTLKANTARALRRAMLHPSQQERIRKRVMEMLVNGQTPREYREYAKLARKVGLGQWWDWAKNRVDLTNPYVSRYYDYFRQHAVDVKPNRA
jgi:hypothetical protein